VTSYSVPGPISSANLTPGSAFVATCSLGLSALHCPHCTDAVVAAPGREGRRNDQRGGRQQGSMSDSSRSPRPPGERWRWLQPVASPDPIGSEPKHGARPESVSSNAITAKMTGCRSTLSVSQPTTGEDANLPAI
jgi:hypothetical protein